MDQVIYESKRKETPGYAEPIRVLLVERPGGKGRFVRVEKWDPEQKHMSPTGRAAASPGRGTPFRRWESGSAPCASRTSSLGRGSTGPNRGTLPTSDNPFPPRTGPETGAAGGEELPGAWHLPRGKQS